MQLGVACAPHKPVPKPSVCSGLGHVWEQSVEGPAIYLNGAAPPGGGTVWTSRTVYTSSDNSSTTEEPLT